jgi:hypothetical protein
MPVKRETEAYLESVRNCFISKRLDPANVDNKLRWGQFIDTNKPGSQAGLYGAISAAISLKAGKKADWTDAKTAQEELQQYWINREKIKGAEDNLCQNIRLAALFLGLSFGADGNCVAISEVAKHLLDHRNPHGNLWAESAVDKRAEVIEEAEYASALVLIFANCGLSFLASNQCSYSYFAQELEKSAIALQKKYLNDTIRKRPYLAAMLIAIILTLGEKANKKVRSRLKKDFLFTKSDLAARYTHYLDFNRIDGTYGRDYFIAPMSMLAPLLLLQPQLSGQEYLYAVRVTESIKDAVDKSFEKNQGLFAEGVTRPSSIEQGLFVLALEAASRKQDRGWKLWWAIAWEQLRRERERGDIVLAWIIIIFLYFPFALASSENILTSQYANNIPNFLKFSIEILSLVPKVWFTAALIAAGAVRKPQDVAKQVLGKK